MNHNDVIECTLKRTLQLASQAAASGEIRNSRHYGRQCREMLLEIYASSCGIPAIDRADAPPFKSPKVRRFYERRLRSGQRAKHQPNAAAVNVEEICQLFCRHCWVYLAAPQTLGIRVGLSTRDGLEPPWDGPGLSGRKDGALGVSLHCGACGQGLPRYQLASGAGWSTQGK